MRAHATKLVIIFFLNQSFTTASFAQSAPGSTAATGDYGNETSTTTNAAHSGPSYSLPTLSQAAVLTPCYLGNLTRTYGRPSGTVNGLPPCTMDSFVRNAAGMADLIYGDEGTDGPPPFEEFTAIHRIDTGIFGDTNKGLTTGHRSHLPSAWGNDEFLGAEWAGQSNAANYNRVPLVVYPSAQTSDNSSESAH